MGFLRGLGTTVCSILLFLTLTVFSVAFLVNATLLNTEFMNSQIDKLDISDIANELIEEQIQEQIPENSDFISGVVFSVVDKQEPLIKEQLHNAINDVYAYFQGKDDTLSVTISLAAIKQSLTGNIWETAKDYLANQLAGMSDAEADRYVGNIAAQIPQDAYPAELAMLPTDLRTQVVKEYIKSLGGKGVFEPLSFGLDFLVEPQIQTSIEQFLGEATSDIEDSYTIDESTFDSGTMRSIRDARRGVITFKAAYIYLIIGMIVLAALIFLINWKNIRASARTLGIDLLIFGILDLAGIIVARYLQPQKYVFENLDVPVSIQNWVNGLASDITGIMMTLTIGIIVVGVVFLVASFFIKKPETASA